MCIRDRYVGSRPQVKSSSGFVRRRLSLLRSPKVKIHELSPEENAKLKRLRTEEAIEQLGDRPSEDNFLGFEDHVEMLKDFGEAISTHSTTLFSTMTAFHLKRTALPANIEPRSSRLRF
eukprot:TRINITY_DN9996_c0_g1_i2.p1 TRINITY_DN9996_c0_g1~~TRINITY_DN9996_c0_g1_i2.p1  ORF type:complete len:135 (+),score=38.09 TRINITY_DN9996_c0_g1_i2:49-405(+)